MTDTRLRELERRWQESGAIDSEAAYLRECMRAGALSERHLAFAAFLGHEPSRLALGSAAPDVPRDFEAWTGEFDRRFGPEADARAWLAEARALSEGFDRDPTPREAIRAAAALLREPTKENARRAARAAYAAAIASASVAGPGADHSEALAAWDQRAGQAHWATWEPREGLRAYSYRGACDACERAVDVLARWRGPLDFDQARQAIVADLVPWVLGRESTRLSPLRILADFEAGVLTRLEREGLLLRALGQGDIGEFVECVTGEALADVLAAARRSPWTEDDWATSLIIGSWCGGEDRAEETEALIRRETRAGVEAVRAHFGIERPE